MRVSARAEMWLGHTDEIVTQEHYEPFMLQNVIAPLLRYYCEGHKESLVEQQQPKAMAATAGM